MKIEDSGCHGQPPHRLKTTRSRTHDLFWAQSHSAKTGLDLRAVSFGQAEPPCNEPIISKPLCG